MKAVAVVVHRYVGLAMALFLIVAGLTGSLLAFQHELDEWLNPSLLRVPPPAGGRPLDSLELLERLQSQLPSGAHTTYVSLEHREGRAASFFVQVPPDRVGSADDNYFVDPYTGMVLGSRRWGEVTLAAKGVMPFMYRLHYSLALDRVGTLLFGVVALLWTVDCYVGAYLTFPPRRGDGAASSTRSSWLSRWKSSWLLRTSKLFSLVFTWHRASGLWVWGFLLVFAWSGVGLNLSEVYNPVMKTLFGMEESAYWKIPAVDKPKPTSALTWTEARERGRELMATRAQEQQFEVFDEKRLDYISAKDAYRYVVSSSRDVSERHARTTVWFDGSDGSFLGFDAPTGEVAGNTITTWLYALHFGSVRSLGMPYRIAVSVMGVAVALLSVTGVWVWWRKLKKRRSKRPGAKA